MLAQSDAGAPGPDAAVAAVQGIPEIDRGLYGGFWRRVAAYVIDTFIICAAMFIVAFVYSIALAMMAASAGGGAVARGELPAVAGLAGAGLFYLAGTVGTWLYYALFESSSLQATPGKRAVDLRVATSSGARAGFGRATGRYFAKFISSIILCIGYVMVAFTGRRQGLHDMMAGTVLVRNSRVGEGLQVISSDNVRSQGLGGAAIAAIVAIGGLIPVAGILAAIAIPAYADYTIRAQVTEGLIAAADYKERVAESLASGIDAGSLDNAALNLPTTDARFKYVESIRVSGGAIVVRYGRQANLTNLSGKSLMLMPGVARDREIVWTCGYASPDPGVQPLFDDYVEYTTIKPKYLPSGCRD